MRIRAAFDVDIRGTFNVIEACVAHAALARRFTREAGRVLRTATEPA